MGGENGRRESEKNAIVLGFARHGGQFRLLEVVVYGLFARMDCHYEPFCFVLCLLV